MSEIKIPDSVTEIGRWAFECCTGLTEIAIPDSVVKIGYRAFWDCENLKCVYTQKSWSDEEIKNIFGENPTLKISGPLQ